MRSFIMLNGSAIVYRTDEDLSASSGPLDLLEQLAADADKQVEKSRTMNAAQAQEIDELKAQLQEKACNMCNYIERKACQCEKAELRKQPET